MRWMLDKFLPALEIKQGIGLVYPTGGVGWVLLHHVAAQFHAAIPIFLLCVNVPLEVQYLEVGAMRLGDFFQVSQRLGGVAQLHPAGG